MNARVLGTRGEIESAAPRHVLRSGILIDGCVLLDLGEKEFLDHRPEAVFITHLHQDHAFFMRGHSDPLETDAVVYAPETTPAAAAVRVAPPLTQVRGLRVSTVPTFHSRLLTSTGYIVEEASSGKRLFYTGDIIWIDPVEWPRLERLDVVITDGSFLRRGGLVRTDPATGVSFGHNGIPDLVELFERFTDHIVFTHFGEWFYSDIADARRRITRLGNASLVEAAYDGMLIEL